MSTEDYILATFSNIFQILVVWRFVRIFFLPRVEKREEMAGYIGYLVFCLVVFFGFQNPLCNMVTSWGGLLLLAVVTYEGTWKKKALIATLVWTVNVMCDAVASYLFYDYIGGDMIPQYIGIFTALLFFICQIVVEKFMGNRGKGDLNHSHIILLGVPAVSAVMLGVLVVPNLNHRVLLVVEGCGGICINLLIFFIYHRMAQEYEERIKKEHMEEQIRMYQNQLELMQVSKEKVRSLRHDMRHHLQVLYGMEEKGHGLGLRNVRELVEKRQGSFQIDYDEKEFRVEVVIYV